MNRVNIYVLLFILFGGIYNIKALFVFSLLIFLLGFLSLFFKEKNLSYKKVLIITLLGVLSSELFRIYMIDLYMNSHIYLISTLSLIMFDCDQNLKTKLKILFEFVFYILIIFTIKELLSNINAFFELNISNILIYFLLLLFLKYLKREGKNYDSSSNTSKLIRG